MTTMTSMTTLNTMNTMNTMTTVTKMTTETAFQIQIQIEITNELRNLNHDIGVSDLQSDSDLDSIRNSCNVLKYQCKVIRLHKQNL